MYSAAIYITLRSTTHWYQKCTLQRFTRPLLFKNFSLVEATYLLYRFIKTMSFLWNAKNTDRNCINAWKTHTPHTERKMTFERVSVKKSNTPHPLIRATPYFTNPFLFMRKVWALLSPKILKIHSPVFDWVLVENQVHIKIKVQHLTCPSRNLARLNIRWFTSIWGRTMKTFLLKCQI